MHNSEDLEKFNSFQEICEIATLDQWCWKLGCGTCGHRLFVISFLNLINEERPYPQNNRDCKDLLFSKADKLQQKVSNINIKYFAKNYKSPRFLAYLGLCLHYTNSYEIINRKLTQTWVPQLIKIIENETWKKYLKKILDNETVLTIKDLEKIEMCFPINQDRYRV